MVFEDAHALPAPSACARKGTNPLPVILIDQLLSLIIDVVARVAVIEVSQCSSTRIGCLFN